MSKLTNTRADFSIDAKLEELEKIKLKLTTTAISNSEIDMLINEVAIALIDWKKEKEELLKIKEEALDNFRKYSDICESAPIGYFSLNRQGEIQEINLQGSKMLGTSKLKLANSTFVNYVAENSLTTYNQFLEKIRSTNASPFCEINIITENKNHIPIHISGSISDNKSEYRLAMVDISARIKVENELKISEQRYSGLFQNIETGILVHSIDKKIIMSNPKASELLGLSAEQMEGKTDIDSTWKFINEEYEVLAVEDYPVNRLGREKEGFKNQILGICQPYSNKVVWVTVNGFLLTNKLKEITEIVISFNDITELKVVEENLKLSEKRYRYNMEITGQIGWSVPEDAMVDDIPMWREYTGQTYEEVKGLKWMDVIHPDDMERTAEIWLNCNARKINYEVEYRVRRADGVYRDFMVRGIPLFRTDGSCSEWVGTCIDITERKQAEEKLRNSEFILRLTQQNALYGTFTFEKTTNTWESSETLNLIFGIDENYDRSLAGLNNIIHTEYQNVILDYLTNENFIEKNKLDIEYKIIKQNNNEVRWVHGIYDSYYIENTKSHKIIGAIQDITSQKHIEEVNNYLLAAINNSDYLMVVKDLNLRVVAANTMWLKNAGYASLGDVIGKTDDQIFDMIRDKNTILTYMKDELDAQKLSQGEFVLREETITSYNGSQITVITKKFPVYDDNGKLSCTAVVATDITEQKAVNEKMKELNETLDMRVKERTQQLEELNKELESFSYSVSHDLRAPLRHIIGFSDLLAKELKTELSEETKHYLTIIKDAAKKMGNLIDDLLNFSRTSRAELKKSLINMNQIIDNAKNQMQYPLNRNIKWQISKMPKVMGDYNLLLIVWVNLIDNALKYSSKLQESIIEINFEENENETIFSISDNGVGFDMKYASKLFGIFQRLHSTAEFEGTGIGLANIQRIIAKHGGRTWAESEINKGATFYFSLPKIN